MRSGWCSPPEPGFSCPGWALLLAAGLAPAACGGTPAPVVQPTTSAVLPADVSSSEGVRVSGVIVAPAHRQLVSGAVVLAPLMAPMMNEERPRAPFRDARILPDGRFRFTGVPPGAYEIRARAELAPPDVAYFATYRVRVYDGDISNVEMMLRPGASVQGRVTYEALEAPAPAGFAGIRVRAPLIDGSHFGDALTGDVAADGTYHIRGVMPGAHLLTVEGLEEPWVVKEILWRGQDVTDVPIDVDSHARLADVRVTLTDAASEVSGTVTDRSGRAVGQALVLIIPASPQFWTPASRRFGRLLTAEDGTYRLRGLPPGEYRVLASTEIDEHAIYRKDLLTGLSAEGTPLRLEARQRRVLDLGLTSLSALRRTAAR